PRKRRCRPGSCGLYRRLARDHAPALGCAPSNRRIVRSARLARDETVPRVVAFLHCRTAAVAVERDSFPVHVRGGIFVSRYISSAARFVCGPSQRRSAVSLSVWSSWPDSPMPSINIGTTCATNDTSAAPAREGSTASTPPNPRSRLALSYMVSRRRLPSVGAIGG